MRARRTCRHHRMVRPLKPKANRDLPRHKIDQRSGNKERRHPLWPFFFDQHRCLGNRSQPANARANHHARAAAIFLRHRLPARIQHRLRCGGHAIKDEIIHLTAVLGFHPVIRVERAVRAIPHRDLAGILRNHIHRIEPRYRPRARLASQQTAPGFLNPACQRRNHPQTCDHHSTHSAPPDTVSFVPRLIHASPPFRNGNSPNPADDLYPPYRDVPPRRLDLLL